VATGRAFDSEAAAAQLSAYMESLAERIGPNPGSWRHEVATVIKEGMWHKGYISSMDDPKFEGMLSGNPWMQSFEAYCEKYVDRVTAVHGGANKGTLILEDAQLAAFCNMFGETIAAATREARPDYAGLTHAYNNLLTRLAEGADPAPDCYMNLQDTGDGGLQNDEPAWEGMVRGAVKAAREQAEGGGGDSELRGHHSLIASGPTFVGLEQPRNLHPEGFTSRSTGGSCNELQVKNSVIVKLVSAGRDSAGLHTAVLIDQANAVFPPMTLFSTTDVQLDAFEFDGTAGLVRVCKFSSGGRAPTPVDDGRGRRHVTRQHLIEWLTDLPALDPVKTASDILPPGADSSIYTVNRTLVTVRATYLLPAAAATGAGAGAGAAAGTAATAVGATTVAFAKLVGDSTQLAYGNRMSYVRGVVEIVFARQLTMAEEWARGLEWTDWTGGTFRDKVEWDYVWCEAAVEGRGGNTGFDEGHGGMVLADFRQLLTDRVAAVGGGDELVPTLEEVTAARLYTGPAYVKLNNFMRLLGQVEERHWRARLAQLEGFTYSSTVFHLINAIRKITQIDALERQKKLAVAGGGQQQQQQPAEGEGEGKREAMLFRGVRGVLPDSFFVPDVQGFISAVDYGFTSTSTDAEVPISFMAAGQLNVLWVLHCTDGADSAGQLHNGAVLQPLSQFPAEAETLLPPLCMLQVLREGGPEDTTGVFRIEHNKHGMNKNGELVTYTEIHARPCFV
jgi:hypothetical protein